MSGKQLLTKEMAVPLSDADIREFLPYALILKYSELRKYPTLHALLPDVKSYCILLYEDSPNVGHWVCVSRPKEGIAEYFDSYGGYVDAPLTWTPIERRQQLGSGKPMLSMMFDECPEEVVYNKVKYQKEHNGVNNCGRWCVLRILKMLKGYDLEQFHRFVKNASKQMKLSPDLMVTALIDDDESNDSGDTGEDFEFRPK